MQLLVALEERQGCGKGLFEGTGGRMIPRWIFFGLLCHCTLAKAPNKHVLLIGLDGVRSDALEAAISELEAEKSAPNFLRLFRSGAYDLNTFAGGYQGTGTQQPTVSGVSWSTVFTGVYANQHGIYSNADLEAGRLNGSIPTLFNYIYHNIRNPYTAALYDFAGLENLITSTTNGGSPDDVFQKKVVDVASGFRFAKELSTLSAHILNHREPQLLFHNTCAADEVGHMSAGGFSASNAEYVDAIKKVAESVDPIIDKINKRREQGQDWLVYMLTDHGGVENDHGDQNPENRRTWMVVENPLDPRFDFRGEVVFNRGLDAVSPTILAYLMGDDYDPDKFPLLKAPLNPDEPPPEAPALTDAAPSLLPPLFPSLLVIFALSLV